ncbi:hypothetical protein Q669_20600 [Labrenzia sp. C1B10]|nr:MULTISPECIES: hypothetical protein [unclassified Labrenzia]ERP98373.1 hypothetical protein Q669_20600 [Labrenzia sp. C1B10]ERS03292.1 hypothetical protein Q675_04615 [Labrenzia sp. C1B70]
MTKLSAATEDPATLTACSHTKDIDELLESPLAEKMIFPAAGKVQTFDLV